MTNQNLELTVQNLFRLLKNNELLWFSAKIKMKKSNIKLIYSASKLNDNATVITVITIVTVSTTSHYPESRNNLNQTKTIFERFSVFASKY